MFLPVFLCFRLTSRSLNWFGNPLGQSTFLAIFFFPPTSIRNVLMSGRSRPPCSTTAVLSDGKRHCMFHELRWGWAEVSFLVAGPPDRPQLMARCVPIFKSMPPSSGPRWRRGGRPGWPWLALPLGHRQWPSDHREPRRPPWV